MIYVSGLGKEISLQQYLRYSEKVGRYGSISHQAQSLKTVRTGNLLSIILIKHIFSSRNVEMPVQENYWALLSYIPV